MKSTVPAKLLSKPAAVSQSHTSTQSSTTASSSANVSTTAASEEIRPSTSAGGTVSTHSVSSSSALSPTTDSSPNNTAAYVSLYRLGSLIVSTLVWEVLHVIPMDWKQSMDEDSKHIKQLPMYHQWKHNIFLHTRKPICMLIIWVIEALKTIWLQCVFGYYISVTDTLDRYDFYL